MKKIQSTVAILHWIIMAAILATIVILGVFTNLTLRSIEKNLPNTLLIQLNDLTFIVEELGDVVSVAERTQGNPSPGNIAELRQKIETTYTDVIKMRDTYVFDNLIQASAFHSVVAPAMADVREWLSVGVSGYAPESPVTIEIVNRRISEAFQKAKTLNRDSFNLAQKILKEQGTRLDRFLYGVNLLFALTLLTTIILIFMFFHQHLLQRREFAAQEERKRAEQSLRESEELFRKLIAAIPDFIVRMDTEGNVLFINDFALEVSGYSREEVEGHSMISFIAPEDHEKAIQNTVLMFEYRLGPQDYHLIMKDGRKVLFEVNGDILRNEDGTPYGMVQVCRNLTERKQTEETLRAQRDLLNSLFDNIPLGITVWDKDGVLINANMGFAELTGYSMENTSSLRDWLIKAFPDPDYRRNSVKDWQASMQSGETVREYQVTCNNGDVIDTELRGTLMPDGRALVTFADISDRRKAEAEREKLQIQLQHAQKMEAMGTLASGIAHDFNNILQAISGNAQLILSQNGAGDRIQKHAQDIEQAVGRASGLVKSLLTSSRKVEPRLKAINVEKEILHAVGILERIIPKMIEINVDISSDVRMILADENQFGQVLMNLGTNARDAMPDGGQLSIQAANETLDEEFCRNNFGTLPGEYVRLTVSDTGQGMEETTLKNIFDPFFTTKEVGRGTGLGMAVVYGIVRNHRGFIVCKSAPGQGAVFTIYWPVYTGKEVEATPEQKADCKELHGQGCILIVDDEETIIRIAEEFLTECGYSVIQARSGEQALELYQEKGSLIDLVLMDLGMPGIGGYKAMVEIHKLDPTAKILIASGYSADGQLSDVLSENAAGFVSKPYKLTDLLIKIREIMEEK